MKESTAMCVAGGACVAGLSLSVINGWLTLVSLVLSIAAGLHYWWKQARRPKVRDERP